MLYIKSNIAAVNVQTDTMKLSDIYDPLLLSFLDVKFISFPLFEFLGFCYFHFLNLEVFSTLPLEKASKFPEILCAIYFWLCHSLIINFETVEKIICSFL